MKPYFRKAEKYTPHPDYTVDLSVSVRSDRAYSKERGKGGLWSTSYGPTNVTSQAMLDAGVSVLADQADAKIAMGIPANPDYNVDRHAAGVSHA